MAPVPRPIPGSVGSRVRLVFGENGDEWLLLLNHDNGNRKWQAKEWSGIPFAVAKQLNNCTGKERDAGAVDFGQTGAWYIHGAKADGSGGHAWWGKTGATDQIREWNSEPSSFKVNFGSDIFGEETCVLIQGNNGYRVYGNMHNDLHERLKRINNGRKTIHFVRLFHDGYFFLSDDEGKLWLFGEGLKHCGKEVRKSGKIEEVAIAGDNSWVVIRENRFVASTGVDEELKQKLSKFFAEQRVWNTERRQEIRDARAAEERERLAVERAVREARELAERAAREAVERAESERVEHEIREAERAERERFEREARDAAELARDDAELNAATRISSLESMLEERLENEVKDIKETEMTIREMETSLQHHKRYLCNRKRSLRVTLQSMPREVQNRISLEDDNDQGAATASNNNICVVCHDESATMAVVPCGHVCLCSTCSDVCINGQRKCPLCRGNMQSVLRIYLGR